MKKMSNAVEKKRTCERYSGTRPCKLRFNSQIQNAQNEDVKRCRKDADGLIHNIREIEKVAKKINLPKAQRPKWEKMRKAKC